MGDEFVNFLASDSTHLVIAWLNGFKGKGDDARPDRGLPPLARMLIGDGCDLMTFVFGPALPDHWVSLDEEPRQLANKNGLWAAILAVSDGVLVDSTTIPDNTPRGYLRQKWVVEENEEPEPLRVVANVLRFSEQDVDTTIHVAFESIGNNNIFEGMCNPPGGDWSGVSFRWGSTEPEYRWLSLPRVSDIKGKRPDHVFALFGPGTNVICLCIESKGHARDLEKDIGPRLTQYVRALLDRHPSVYRATNNDPWRIFEPKWNWNPPELDFISVGTYLSKTKNPFSGLPNNSDLDIQIGITFLNEGQSCTLHMRGDTAMGQNVVGYLERLLNNMAENTEIGIQVIVHNNPEIQT